MTMPPSGKRVQTLAWSDKIRGLLGFNYLLQHTPDIRDTFKNGQPVIREGLTGTYSFPFNLVELFLYNKGQSLLR